MTKRRRGGSPFAFKDRKGRWRLPNGRFTTAREGRKLNKRVHRALVFKAVREDTRESREARGLRPLTIKTIRRRFKGVPTEAIVGKFAGRGAKGKPRILRDTPKTLNARARKLQQTTTRVKRKRVKKSKRELQRDQKRARRFRKIAKQRKRADDTLDDFEYFAAENILQGSEIIARLIDRRFRRTRIKKLRKPKKRKARPRRKKR